MKCTKFVMDEMYEVGQFLPANYVYLTIILTQEEEHNQRFHQLSVEFLTHFVHLIHPYMTPLPNTQGRKLYSYLEHYELQGKWRN